MNIFFLFFLSINILAEQKAVFIKPVTDLFFDQLSVVYPQGNIDELYFNQPYASRDYAIGCRRAAQALFNEVVTVIKENGNECLVARTNLFYAPEKDPKLCYYWVHKKNLMFLDTIDSKLFPDSIDFAQPQTLEDQRIITLTQCWFDTNTQQWYSAGTRFVRNFEDTKHTRGVIFFDFENQKIIVTNVPKKIANIYKQLSLSKRRAKLIKLIRSWLETGIIPYVWGGYSIMPGLEDNSFEEIVNKQNAGLVRGWWRPQTMPPFGGVDCSGVISLAAHIVGIPYFFKNTLTLSRYLKPIRPQDSLEIGDLIWFPGHVMLISDIKHNLIIEAAGYQSGFGQLQEIEVCKRFKNVKTYDDLLAALYAKQKLILLNQKGEDFTTVYAFNIFKLSSIKT